MLGDDVDLRFNPHQEAHSKTVLHNTIVAGGTLAIIDEAHFIDADDMAVGLERFFQEEPHPERLRLIVVCTHRQAGDPFLAFLVLYCGIHNIIYGKTGVDVSIELSRLIERDNTRADVLHLAESGRWQTAKRAGLQLDLGDDASSELIERDASEKDAFKKISRDVLIDVKGARLLNLHIEISAVVE